MPFSALNTTKTTVSIGLLAATTVAVGAVALPSSASASSRPLIRTVQPFVNRCSDGDHYGISLYTTGGTARTATVSQGGVTKAMQGGPTATRGRGYFVLPTGRLQTGQRLRLTVAVSGPGGTTRSTRTVRTQLLHACQG